MLFKDGRRDQEWDQKLALELVTLQAYKDDLKNRLRLNVDDVDRVASFRIDPRAPDSDFEDLQRLSRVFPELDNFPSQLRRTEHTPYPPTYACYQFVPVSGGKASVLEFIMARLGVGWENVAAFGDDLNDQEMMERAALPMTLVGANGSIQKLALDKGGSVAPGYSHHGTALALSYLLNVVKAQQTGSQSQ